MRILYGVTGEGMGHAIRSKVILEHLLSRGHQVEIMASGRAEKFLARHFADVNEIHGFHMIAEDNEIRIGRTLLSNIFKGAAGLPKNIAAYFDLIEDFEPEAVISDFESWTYYYGKLHDLPVFSIDNMQIINRCRHPDAVLDGLRLEFEVTRAFVKSKLPFCDHYLITSIARPPVRKERTTLFPPILRPEILAAERRRGEHILVYQSVEPGDLAALARGGREVRVYGVYRDLTEDRLEAGLLHRPFSEAQFIDDLASARAVIASAGFTLMGEAVTLGVPMLAIPIGNQLEQALNARYLEHLGYGLAAGSIDDRRTLDRFLDRLDDFEARLAEVEHDGNRALLDKVDALLARVS